MSKQENVAVYRSPTRDKQGYNYNPHHSTWKW